MSKRAAIFFSIVIRTAVVCVLAYVGFMIYVFWESFQ